MDINYIYTKVKDREPYINGWEKFKRASVTIPLINYNNSLTHPCSINFGFNFCISLQCSGGY